MPNSSSGRQNAVYRFVSRRQSFLVNWPKEREAQKEQKYTDEKDGLF
jgi:hypothetical protein